MSKVRVVTAFFSGLFLYNVFVYLGGMLSAIQIPNGYFDFFGSQHKVLALFVLEATTFAFPCFLLSAIWSWITLRTLSPVRDVAKWCFGGILFGWLYWQAKFIFIVLPEPNLSSVVELLAASLVTPVWTVLNVLAVPLGFIAAVLLAIKNGNLGLKPMQA